MLFEGFFRQKVFDCEQFSDIQDWIPKDLILLVKKYYVTDLYDFRAKFKEYDSEKPVGVRFATFMDQLNEIKSDETRKNAVCDSDVFFQRYWDVTLRLKCNDDFQALWKEMLFDTRYNNNDDMFACVFGFGQTICDIEYCVNSVTFQDVRLLKKQLRKYDGDDIVDKKHMMMCRSCMKRETRHRQYSELD